MTLIAILCAYTLVFVGISAVQINFLKKEKAKKAVILDEKTYQEAANIAIANEKFAIFSHFYSLVLSVAWLLWGFAWLKGCVIGEPATLANAADTAFATAANATPSTASAGSTLENTLFLLAFLIINTLLSLPLSAYKAFVKDKKHGFSTITPALFIKDSLKNLALLAVFGFLFLYVLLLCYEFLGTWWWLGASGVAFAVCLIIIVIYPTLIVPLYNKMQPLQDEALQGEISQLLNKCGFSSKGVFVMDASKRDKRLNAYFGGLSKCKRVVLFDTLLKTFDAKQLLAVLGHELGHFVHKDLLKGLFSSALMMFLLFFVFAHLPEFFYKESHLDGVNAGVFALLIMFNGVFDLLFSPLINAMSRKNEFAADRYGAKMTSSKDMREALLVLAKENKAFIKASRLYALFHHSHPSIDERLKALA